jgi:hypothetical protein
MLTYYTQKIADWYASLNAVKASIIISLLAFFVRMPFVIWAPARSPDSESYMTIGNNIFLNGCVSLSDPVAGICVPTWGGNHLPGYPAFLAMFGGIDFAILTAQNIIYAAACFYFISVLWDLWRKPAVVFSVGLILALSPLQIGWGRFILPDLLAHSVFIWILAELALSIRDGQLRWFSIGIASACAIFLRYDGILLAIPIAITGFWLHGFKVALGKGLLIATIILIPLGGWWARSVALELSWIPEQRFMFDGSFAPNGYRAWVRTWSSNLHDSGKAAYSVSQKYYSKIEINPVAWDTEEEKERVINLLDELKEYEFQDFPKHIDDAFRELAKERRARDPVHQYMTLTLLRAKEFWFAPYYSFGLPGIELGENISVEDRKKVTEGNYRDKISIALKFPVPAIGKATLTSYRILLFLFVPLMVYFIFKRSESRYRCLFSAMFGFAFIKVLLLSFQASVDTRYLASVFAVFEIFAMYWLGAVLSRAKSMSKTYRTDS